MNEQRVRAGWLIGMAILFAIAHTQSPYVWSNQNQYYLHGAAMAAYGDLKNDWLANTRDPTPVFSWLVALAYLTVGPIALSALFFLMLMVYFITIDRLLNALFGIDRKHRYLTMAVFLVCHAAIVRVASVWLFGKDYPWYLQTGLASQYVLGPGLQPSVFGIFLLVGLANFAEGRPYRAAVWAALAGVVHPTYFLIAAMCIAGFQIELCESRKWRQAICTGLIALIVVLPMVIYTAYMFLPSDEKTFANALRIFIYFRFPHHCIISQWFDSIALMQVVFVIVGWWLTWRKPIFLTLGVILVASISLTVIQSGLKLDFLALLFPWRASVILVPIALAMMIDWLLRLGFYVNVASRCPHRMINIGSFKIAVAAAIGGIYVSFSGIGYYVNRDEDGVLDFVAKNRRPGDLYLLPLQIPDLKAGDRGSRSMTFVTPTPTNQGIPPDFQRFRLATGAAITVDFKSVPYADWEVVEWRDRLLGASLAFGLDKQFPGGWDAVAASPSRTITCIVEPNRQPRTYRFLEEVYADEHYRVLRFLSP
jgi:hypothetical protein